MWRLLFVSLLLVSSVQAQQQLTAYDALKIVGTQFHRAAIRHVISVTGTEGDPQPVRWNVLIADRNAPAGVRELQVANGRIVSNTTPSRAAAGTAATINTAYLNLDSSGAFTVANHTADQSHTNFSFVSYTLRTNERGYPTWIVTLQDETRRPLGTIYIAANKGNVTRVEGLYHGRNMDQIEQDPVNRDEPQEEYVDAGPVEEEPEASDSDDNVVKAEIKRMFRRTKRDAQRIFERVHQSFDDFVFNQD
jgi:hypothetical protein